MITHIDFDHTPVTFVIHDFYDKPYQRDKFTIEISGALSNSAGASVLRPLLDGEGLTNLLANTFM